MRNKLGQYIKGYHPPTEFKKGLIPWNKGLATKITKKCVTCNKIFEVSKWRSKYQPSKYCSHKCRPAWNKGKIFVPEFRKTIDGYIRLRNQQKQHRLIMEKYINRKLQDWEIVHHINNIRDDNKLENLKIMTRSEHMKLHMKLHRKLQKIACCLVILLLTITNSYAEDYSNESICDAIFKAEGSDKAQYLYGIRSVSYDSPKEARQICLNTVRNHRNRHLSHDDGLTYLECLSHRYAPLNTKNDRKGLNKNWLRLVKYFLTKQQNSK